MNNQFLISALGVAVILGGLLWWGRANPPADSQTAAAAAATSSLVASESFYDFGTISMTDGNVEKVFTITNQTDKDVTIESAMTSCMCTVAYIEGPESRKGPYGMPGHGGLPPVGETIRPGESRALRVVFDPNAHGPAGVGRIGRLVELRDEEGGVMRFEIQANVTP